MNASIFISHASPDRNHVERLVTFLEAHHFKCWVSYRDVGVGENYQEAITRAVRSAKVLIVVFTRNANSSSEMQKELSLASRYKLLVIPLRIEDVEPGDALAYELATHQWVDMFRNWSAGGERLLLQLEAILAPDVAGAKPRSPSPELAAVLAGRPATAPLFVPPRQAFGDLPGPAAAVPASAAFELAVPMQRRDSRAMGLTKFVLIAVTFGLLLSTSLRQGEVSVLQLIFWAILAIGCIRLFSAILRALFDGLGPNSA